MLPSQPYPYPYPNLWDMYICCIIWQREFEWDWSYRLEMERLFWIIWVVLLLQSRLTLFSPIDYSMPGSPVHRIFQARILEWVAISLSRGSSWPRDWTHVSCIGRWILYRWATWLGGGKAGGFPEAWVQSLGWEDPLDERMATHPSNLAWRISTDRHDWSKLAHTEPPEKP